MKHLIRCTLIASGVVASAATLSVVANPGMSDYERWRATTQQEFQSYLDENDKAFIGFLKQRWEPVDTESGEEEDQAPKPTNIPKAPPVNTPVNTPEEKPKDITTEPTPVVSVPVPTPTREPDNTTPEQTPVKVAPQPQIKGPAASINFYGHALRLPYNKAMPRAFSISSFLVPSMAKS